MPFIQLFLCLLAASADVEWRVNGGENNIRYSPLTQITRENVAQLKVAWSYDSHDAFKDSEMQSNPIVIDGVLYATTPKLRVIALDAATGREIWAFDPSGGAAAQRRYRHRGVTVYQDRVFFTHRNFLWALDRKTGKPIPSFGSEGHIDLREGLDRPVEKMSVSASSPGVIFEDMIILGSTVPETLPGSPGHIRAFDTKTGKLRWIFHTIPRPGEFGYDTWSKDSYQISGGANAWAGLSVDAKLGMVFAATRLRVVFDFYGANRIGDNLFANCVLALDARTGRRIWHFQGASARYVGSRLSRRPQPRHRHARRQAGRRRRADHQHRLRFRARSQDRQAALSHQISERPRLQTRWRKALHRAAVPRQAAALHAPGFHRSDGHQPHAGSARRRPQAIPRARFQRHVYAGEPARHDPFPRHRWRRRGMGRRMAYDPESGIALRREFERAAPGSFAW